MAIDTLQRLFVFIGLVLAQALVLNRIQLFNCATPLLFVYFVIIFPRNYPRWASLLWSFFLGLSVDMFSNTPGVATTSLTLIGFLQPFLLELFLPREPEENIRASASTLGFWRFTGLTAILLTIFCLLFFALELFSISGWLYWLQCAGASLLFTFILIMAVESLRGEW